MNERDIPKPILAAAIVAAAFVLITAFTPKPKKKGRARA